MKLSDHCSDPRITCQRRVRMSLSAFLVASLILLQSALGAASTPYSGITTPVASSGFQPSAPYYATFFYPWFRNQATNGSWAEGAWGDNGHSPPANWFSNYLPDPHPSVFAPSTELYSSTDDATIYWQLEKLAEARQEVAISSWWGPGHRTDTALKHILDLMNRPDNPYPNLRWAAYYEKEGFGDPSVNEIAGDLRYIVDHLANHPAYFRIDNKPVVFVYGDANDGPATANRWHAARDQAGVDIYLVLKVFPGYTTVANQPNSWHQYAPAARSDTQPGYYYMVSPGFWKDGEAIRLPRNPDAFEQSVKSMVASPAQWKLTETWNEWGEGTAVEPGTEVEQTTTGTAVIAPHGTPFGNVYVDILHRNLPALERGTGAGT